MAKKKSSKRAPLPAIDPEQPMFLRIPVKCFDVVHAALLAAGHTQVANAVDSFTRDYRFKRENARRLKWIELADERHGGDGGDGEPEFDSDSTVSHSDDDGEYVLGWVWVSTPDEWEEKP